ncbi:hypothetical protein D3C86_2231560 [compost metagenome]
MCRGAATVDELGDFDVEVIEIVECLRADSDHFRLLAGGSGGLAIDEHLGAAAGNL